MKINTVTVIGANGTMGSNVAGIFASFGNAKVFLICRTLEKGTIAKEKAAQSVKSDAIKENLIIKTYDDLAYCLELSDLVFESVAEDFFIKCDINKKINQYAKPNTIIATGTSSLSIQELAECFSEENRKYYMGMHFFNPPYHLTLCELIMTQYADQQNFLNARKYLERVLLREVIVVKDAAAFLGNRIGFQFINGALQLAEKYKKNGGIDYIDAIFGPFTGRNMGPIATADFVGLDIHKAIVNYIYENCEDLCHNTFLTPGFIDELIMQKRLGRKTKMGLYRTKILNGVKIEQVYDIKERIYREKYNYYFPFVEKMVSLLKIGEYNQAIRVLVDDESLEAKICLQQLLKYIVYSLYVSHEVATTTSDCDVAMADGFSWIPPIACMEALGGKEAVYQLVKEYVEIEYYELLLILENKCDIPNDSIYDYRKFLKAIR